LLFWKHWARNLRQTNNPTIFNNPDISRAKTGGPALQPTALDCKTYYKFIQIMPYYFSESKSNFKISHQLKNIVYYRVTLKE